MCRISVLCFFTVVMFEVIFTLFFMIFRRNLFTYAFFDTVGYDALYSNYTKYILYLSFIYILGSSYSSSELEEKIISILHMQKYIMYIIIISIIIMVNSLILQSW